MNKNKFHLLTIIIFVFFPVLLLSQIKINNKVFNIDGIFKDKINNNYVSLIIIDEDSEQINKDYSDDIIKGLRIITNEGIKFPLVVYSTIEARKKNYGAVFEANKFNAVIGQDDETVTISEKNIFKDIGSSEILSKIFVHYSALTLRDMYDKDSTKFYFNRFKELKSNITKIENNLYFNESMAYFEYMEDNTKMDTMIYYLDKSYSLSNRDVKFLNNYSKFLYRAAIANYWSENENYSLVKSRLKQQLSINSKDIYTLSQQQIDSAKFISAKCSYFMMKDYNNNSELNFSGVKEIEEYFKSLNEQSKFYYDALLLLGNTYYLTGDKDKAMEKYLIIKNSDKSPEKIKTYAKENLELLTK